MAPDPDAAPRRGSVVLVLFLNSDLRMEKLRPALVVQADGLGTGLHQVILAMIFTRMFRAGHPSRVTVHQSSEQGKRSGLMTDTRATVTSAAIDRVIGEVSTVEVATALRRSLGR